MIKVLPACPGAPGPPTRMCPDRRFAGHGGNFYLWSSILVELRPIPGSRRAEFEEFGISLPRDLEMLP